MIYLKWVKINLTSGENNILFYNNLSNNIILSNNRLSVTKMPNKIKQLWIKE